MLNKYPFWKYLLIILVLLPGFLYALPNLFGDDPGVQIRGARGASLGAADLERVEAILADEEISAAAVTLDDSGIKIRLADGDAQLRAREALRRELAERRFSIALTLLPAAPQWLGTLYARPMYLGLDLRGGVHFLMEMDLDAALADHMQNTAADLRTELRRARRASAASCCNCPACRIPTAPRKSSAAPPPWRCAWWTKTMTRRGPPKAARCRRNPNCTRSATARPFC